MPSPGGKVGRRKPGRMRDGDTRQLGVGLQQRQSGNISARIPHQSRFARQLPPGGSQGRFAPKPSTLNYNLNLPYSLKICLLHKITFCSQILPFDIDLSNE